MLQHYSHPTSGRRAGRSLTGKKNVPQPVFPKKPAGTPCAQAWLVAVGGWRLAAVGGWQLATGGWWRLAVVGSWRLVAAGGWRRLVVGGWWRLAVGGPLGRSLRAVLSKKKKIWFLKDCPVVAVPQVMHWEDRGKKYRRCLAPFMHFTLLSMETSTIAGSHTHTHTQAHTHYARRSNTTTLKATRHCTGSLQILVRPQNME